MAAGRQTSSRPSVLQMEASRPSGRGVKTAQADTLPRRVAKSAPGLYEGCDRPGTAQAFCALFCPGSLHELRVS